MLHLGTAGWSITRASAASFGGDGTHLERYARVLAGAEINASFYRPLRPELYARWAASTPPGFRFAVKIPRAITHEQRLARAGRPLDAFLAQVAALGDRLGPLLVQLPPSLAWDGRVASRFLTVLRERFAGSVVIEPRHESWFTNDVAKRLAARGIARVAADPARVPEAAEPGGDASIVYYRLHGSPRIYWSRYDDAWLDALAERLRRAAARADVVWCIFDNTASGAAIENALALRARLSHVDSAARPTPLTTRRRMATVQELEIHCGTCGYWMPAPAPDPAADAATLIGSVVQCRKCLQRTTAAPANMRVKREGGGYAHWDDR